MVRNEDIPWLSECLSGVEEELSLIEKWHKVLRFYAKPAGGRSAHSYSRVVQASRPYSDFFDICGHIAAHLVESDFAEELLASGAGRGLYDGTLVRAARSSEASAKQERYPRRTLVIANLHWRPCHEDLALLFLRSAVGGLVRWFEGNRIDSILFRFSEGDLVSRSLLHGIAQENVSTGPCDEKQRYARICSVPVRYEGVTQNWADTLLEWYGDVMDSGDLIKDRRKLICRVLHEFDFDVLAAVEAGCLHTWSISEKDGKRVVYAFNKWRRRLADDLKLNMPGSTGAEIIGPIRRLLADEPHLMVKRWESPAARDDAAMKPRRRGGQLRN